MTDVPIHFSEDQLTSLNYLLAFLMFSVAMDIDFRDFRAVVRNPKAFFTGIFSQWVALPLLTLTIILVAQPPQGIALGMLLVASCPGGNVSNYAVHLSGGNTALSISMTSLVTLAATFTTPFLFGLYSGVFSAKTGSPVTIDLYAMALIIIQLVIIPLALGYLIRRLAPRAANWLNQPIRITSFSLFMLFILFAIWKNRALFTDYFSQVFWIVLIFNGLALITGYTLAYLAGLGVPERKSISIETGIQNSGLALIIIFNCLDGAGQMALIAAWWGVWHLISAFGLSMLWRKRTIINHTKLSARP